MPITVSGSVFSSRNAASAHAGAVFLAAGSLRICSLGTSGSCSRNHVTQKIVRDHPNVGGVSHRQQPIHRLLNHRPLAIQRQHLLRPRPPAPRPEPCSTSTRKNHRSKSLLRLTAFIHVSISRKNRIGIQMRPSLDLSSQASQSTPASASRPHPPPHATPHTTAEYVPPSQMPHPEPRPHAPRSAASPPGPTPTSTPPLPMNLLTFGYT